MRERDARAESFLSGIFTLVKLAMRAPKPKPLMIASLLPSGAFPPPNAYPALALAVVGSHDLPTLRGRWEGPEGAPRSLSRPG